jgi:hypothetical protein
MPSSKTKAHIQHHRTFLLHLLFNILLAITIVIISLFLGMWGYHHFEQMTWIDAYVNAAMILSGMGPVTTLHTASGKIFAGSYAIFSGVIFLVLIAFILSPLIRWIFIKFHLESKNSPNLNH